MCFLLLSINQSSDYPFILAANRDEYYERNTASLDYWSDKPHILGGRDLEQGGSWMAVNESGKFAAITNFRESSKTQKPSRSRGLIITDFLDSDITSEEFQQIIERQGNQYDGFNLIFGKLGHGFSYYSNRGDEKAITLEPENYVLSNHLLNTPWPKAIRGKSSFEKILSKKDRKLEDELFGLLKDNNKASHSELPDTGLSKDFEHLLSSIYIESANYGTRSSSVVILDSKNNLRFTEYTHPQSDNSKSSSVTFNLQL